MKFHPPVINVRQPDRMEQPDGKTTLFSTLSTPVGFLLIFAFYAGNLLAAYEIAVFRGRPVALVCGLSAILPVIGPILFISLPGIESVSQYDSEPLVDDTGAPGAPPAPAAPQHLRHLPRLQESLVWGYPRGEQQPVVVVAVWLVVYSQKMIQISIAILSKPNSRSSSG